MKVHTICGTKYYNLHAVSGKIGLTYAEIYHNYDKWEEPLGLYRHNGHIYIQKNHADNFIKNTPNYVPLEYYYKRNPINYSTPQKGLIPLKRKVIRKSIWIYKLSLYEKKA